MVGLIVGIVGQCKHCGSIIKGIAMDCCHVDCSNRVCGINMGVAIGQRSWTVDAQGLAKAIRVLLCIAG